MSALSIIVPTLNEADGIGASLVALQPLRRRGAEVIVVDGASTDNTCALAAPFADAVISAPRSRSRQMNAGAALARGAVLLFLHADTRLPEAADRLIADALAASDNAWGRFDVSIAGASRLLGMIAWFMNRRSRITGIATGDQAIFVGRNMFRAVGGYAEISLMEDIELSRRLKRCGRPVCLRQRVTTSGRRWDRSGALRTMLLMWRLRLTYRFGADPDRLAAQYGQASRGL